MNCDDYYIEGSVWLITFCQVCIHMFTYKITIISIFISFKPLTALHTCNIKYFVVVVAVFI